MAKNVGLNVHELRKLAQSSLTAEAMFKEWASRQRHTTHTDVRRLRVRLLDEGVEVKDAQYLGVFEKLEQLQVGHIIKSATGRPQLFVWNARVEVVGKTGLERDGGGAVQAGLSQALPPAAEEIEVYVRISGQLYRCTQLEPVASRKEVPALEKGA